MTAVPQTNGDGTPNIMKPIPARMPCTTGTTTTACRAPWMVRSRWSKICRSCSSEKGEIGCSSARSRPPSRSRKKSMSRKRPRSSAAWATLPSTFCSRMFAPPASCSMLPDTTGVTWAWSQAIQARRPG